MIEDRTIAIGPNKLDTFDVTCRSKVLHGVRGRQPLTPPSHQIYLKGLLLASNGESLRRGNAESNRPLLEMVNRHNSSNLQTPVDGGELINEINKYKCVPDVDKCVGV